MEKNKVTILGTASFEQLERDYGKISVPHLRLGNLKNQFFGIPNIIKDLPRKKKKNLKQQSKKNEFKL